MILNETGIKCPSLIHLKNAYKKCKVENVKQEQKNFEKQLRYYVRYHSESEQAIEPNP
jgi:hypothetical protein